MNDLAPATFTFLPKAEFVELVYRRLLDSGWPVRLINRALLDMWAGNMDTTSQVNPHGRFVLQIIEAANLSSSEQRLWRYHFNGGD